MKDMNRMAQDYRLNWRLNSACDNDIRKLCPNMCSTGQSVPCGGLVLQCLQDKQDNITSQACQDEVFYYELMEVSDFRNDVILAEACRNDVESYCKDVEPGALARPLTTLASFGLHPIVLVGVALCLPFPTVPWACLLLCLPRVLVSAPQGRMCTTG